METIPYDIIINNIIPYTYNTQSNLLLEDIKKTLNIILEYLKKIYYYYMMKQI